MPACTLYREPYLTQEVLAHTIFGVVDSATSVNNFLEALVCQGELVYPYPLMTPTMEKTLPEASKTRTAWEQIRQPQ